MAHYPCEMAIEAAAGQKASHHDTRGRRRSFGDLRRDVGLRWMYVADTVMFFSAAMLISFVRWGTDWPNYPFRAYLGGFAVVTGVHVIVAYFGGIRTR